ncbi:MAG TPA: DUF1697 domain-containing protein [Devosia sp.]|nr:DUF1697 domain-containing protein [Devosia sp.]
MTAYIALLRGIGPATHTSMPLGELAAACEAVGLGAVTSVGNTGNLVLSSERPQAEVERLVSVAVEGFGLANEVFTRTVRQWRKLIDSAPFPDAIAERPGRLGVCFFHKDPSWPRAYRDYRGPERMTMLSNHLIIDYGEPSLVTRLTVEKTVGARMTQRNWSSILRIAAVVEGM